MDEYKVYVRTTDAGLIFDVNSSAFITDPADWVEIDSGTGRRYYHAQGNYFDKPFITDSGVYQYKLVDGKPVECTEEEIAEQEAANRPDPIIPDPDTPDVDADVWGELDTAYQEGVDSV